MQTKKIVAVLKKSSSIEEKQKIRDLKNAIHCRFFDDKQVSLLNIPNICISHIRIIFLSVRINHTMQWSVAAIDNATLGLADDVNQ